ncbi:MAG: hypothetical protein ACRDIV_11855 [Ktedonobacteraceae bacterium]
MAAQQTYEVGNAVAVLVDSNDPFSDGYITGYLEFYDERHRPLFPLTSQGILDYFKTILSEPSCTDLWKAGRITGWIEAIIENAPETFRSVVLDEHVGVLQGMKKKKT